MKHIDLEKFASGAFSAQVNRELEKVTQNIQDPNTDATAVRKITVTISLKPNDNRNFVATGVQAKSTLAPALGAVTAIAMGKDIKTGEVDAVEIGDQIPGQMSIGQIEESAEEEKPETVKTVDPSTGEIYETLVTNATSNVIDLRAARQA